MQKVPRTLVNMEKIIGLEGFKLAGRAGEEACIGRGVLALEHAYQVLITSEGSNDLPEFPHEILYYFPFKQPEVE